MMEAKPDNHSNRDIVQEMRRFYSGTVVEHALYPRNFKEMPDADGSASLTDNGGDSIKLWLRVNEGRITDVSFQADACVAAVATLSMLTELVRGRTIVGALAINGQEILDALGGLPPGNVHCAHQAVTILRQAIRDYHTASKEPWKKMYRQP